VSQKSSLLNWNNSYKFGGFMVLKKNLIYLLILLVSLPLLLYAQTDLEQTTPLSSENFFFSFDHAIFRTQQDKALIELYYSIFRDYLKFVLEDSVFKASFSFKAEIWQGDSLVAQNLWKNINTVDSLAEIGTNQKLYGVGYFVLAPGEYKYKVELADLNSQYSKIIENNFIIEQFSQNKIDMSDLQLASKISPSTEKNRFYKNGYVVIPNTDRFYGTGLPMLMIYAEVYNLKKENEPDTAKYSINYKLYGSDNQMIRSFPNKIRVKPGNSAVEVSGMNIISFRSGTYFIEINVTDLFTKETVSKKKKFFVFRQGDMAIADSTADKLQKLKLSAAYERIYNNMTEDEIDDEFGAATYLATKEEKKIFKKLDQSGKQSFLIEFWKKRDRTPNTPINEFRENYLAAKKAADERYSGFGKGWKTDRGRILLMYGEPDEYERHPYSSENKPYVIWKYFSIQGGILFYFVDKRDFGNYELVHSTARGELYDPEWQRWINPH